MCQRVASDMSRTFIFGLFLCGLLGRPASAQELAKGQTVVVTADEAQVLRGKEVVGSVTKGQELVIVDENLAWLGVEWTAADGQQKSGWIQKRQVAPKPQKRMVTVTTLEAQVHRGKELVATVKRGQHLVVVDESAEWLGVQWMTPEGELLSGWIKKEAVGAKSEPEAVIVTVEGARVYRGSDVVAALRKGQELFALQTRDDWTGVEWTTPAGEAQSGWIKADQLAPKPKGEEVIVEADQAQVFRGATVVGTVRKGARLLAIRKSDDWLGVEWTTKEGATQGGWIKEEAVAFVRGKPKLARKPTPPTPGEQEILVRSLQLEGNTLLSSAALSALFSGPLARAISPTGVQITLEDIRQSLQAILKAYHEAGYRAVAVYVPQDSIETATPLAFRNDELKVKIVEGHVANSTVDYQVMRKRRPWRTRKSEYPTRDKIIKERIEKLNPIEAGDVLQQEKLERFIQFLERHPGRSAVAVVKKPEEAVAGTELGRDVDLEIRVVDPEPTAFYFQLTNLGTASTEEYRFRAGFIHNNLYGRDDILSFDFSAPFDGLDENYAVLGSYDTPLWDPRLRLRAYGAYNEFTTSDILGPDTPFLGEGYLIGEELRYTLYHHDGWLVDTFQGLDLQASKLSFLSETISEVDLVDLSLGVRLQHLKGAWRPYLQAKVAYNLSDTILCSSDQADFERSRLNTEPGYLNFTLSGSQSLRMNDWLSLSQRFGAGYSADRLIGAKEFAIGGIHTVRGYETSEVLGDRGLFVATEPLVSLNTLFATKLDTKLPLRIDLVPAFFDIGTVEIEEPVAGEEDSTTICSVGTGARINFKNLLSGRIYWGHALREAHTGETKAGDNKLHLDLSLQLRF